MSTWEQAFYVATQKAYAERRPWYVLAHPDPNGPDHLHGWCYHAWRGGQEATEVERFTPPGRRR